MKKPGIITCLFILFMMAGCAGDGRNISQPEQNETVSEEISAEETSLDETETESAEDEAPASVTEPPAIATVETRYYFNIETLEPESISIGIYIHKDGDECYTNSGYMFVKDTFEYKDDPLYGTPLLSYYDEKVDPLPEEDIAELRSVYEEFYNENLADAVDDVRDKYIEIAQDMSLWESSSMEVDYNDRMKKEFVLHIGGNDYLIRAAECYLRFPSVKMGSHVKDIDAVSVPGFDNGHGQLKYLWGFVVSYRGEMEKPESYFGYLKDKWTAAKEYSSSLAPEEEDIAAASEEDDTEAAEDTDDAAENAPEDTGILGRWYPDYSDFGDYFIQFNEGGTGIIMRNGEAIPITYTYSGNMIYVSVPSTGGTNEFSYERGYLYSDFDGDRYTRRNGK